MENRKIIIESPVKIGEYILIPVVSILITGGVPCFSAYKKPLAMVIKSPSGTQCFSIDGQIIPLESLTKEFSELESILDLIQYTSE